jgi:hypothetical protein
MPYTRALKYQLPLMSGTDVIAVQQRLRDLGYSDVGQPDGIFGARTESAVRVFQQSRNLRTDGVVGPLTWTALFQDTGIDTSLEKITRVLDDLKQPHAFRDSVEWSLSPDGLVIGNNKPEISGGEPRTVGNVWHNFRTPVEEWAGKFGVPVELIIATICTETSGDPRAARQEPGYLSDEKTPGKVSIGLMQTLIANARDTLKDGTIDRNWLFEPGNAIRAGTAYIAQQWKITLFDPPKVACAYNAGSVYYNESQGNRWRMRQFPINSSAHADRFIKWFNDCFILFDRDTINPSVSFYRLLRR